MLSSEMATVLTGRYIQIGMLPFSLEETLLWNKINIRSLHTEEEAKATVIADSYLREGGYPEAIQARGIQKSYLSTLFDSILLKDVAKRHKIRNTTDLYNLASYLLSNFCNTFTYGDLTEELGFASVNTMKKFCDYLAEPYLFFYLPRYDNKLKLMKKAPRKVYVVDNGFVGASGFNTSENLGRLLENQIFIELLRRGYHTEKTIFYYRSRNDREVDFVLREGAKVKTLVQVCYDMSSAKTRKRELDALVECSEELKCDDLLVVTMHEEEEVYHKGKTIHVLPILKY